MRLSDQFAVPPGAALLYDFANTLDERRYVVDHRRLQGGDAVDTLAHLEEWLTRHGLCGRCNAADWREAVALRNALRAYFKLPPTERSKAASALGAAASRFTLRIEIDPETGVNLVPTEGADTLGSVLVQLHALAAAGQLDRMKACADPDCQWIFLDRSKPGSRRWCSSSGCGNRQKTRAYRARRDRADRPPSETR